MDLSNSFLNLANMSKKRDLILEKISSLEKEKSNLDTELDLLIKERDLFVSNFKIINEDLNLISEKIQVISRKNMYNSFTSKSTIATDFNSLYSISNYREELKMELAYSIFEDFFKVSQDLDEDSYKRYLTNEFEFSQKVKIPLSYINFEFGDYAKSLNYFYVKKYENQIKKINKEVLVTEYYNNLSTPKTIEEFQINFFKLRNSKICTPLIVILSHYKSFEDYILEMS